jgi:hypothetical protein
MELRGQGRVASGRRHSAGGQVHCNSAPQPRRWCGQDWRPRHARGLHRQGWHRKTSTRSGEQHGRTRRTLRNKRHGGTLRAGRPSLLTRQFFYFSKLTQICKLWKPPLCCSKIYQILQSDRMKEKEQLSFWKQVQTQNRIWIKIPGRRPTFEFGSNLLGVQTCLEKSDNFPKILICLDLLDCEFRLTWLYDKIWSLHTSSP